jgi:hypothetical protein
LLLEVPVRYVRFVAALICVAALTACGGGGGSSSGGGGGGGTPPQSNISQQSVQRTDVQSGLSGLQAYESYEGGGSLTSFTATRALTAAVRRRGRAVLTTRRRDGAAGCDDGVVQTEVPNSSGTVVTVTVSVYYDAACDNIESTLVWAASETSSTEISGPATLTNYSTTGAVTETANATIAFYLNSQDELTGLSILATSIVANGVSLGQAGIACNVPSLSSFSCGVAAATNIASSSLEDGANVSLSGSQTSTQLTVSMSISTYQGALNALSITAATFPDWTISPSADLLGSLSMSGTESPTSTTVSLTMTDSTNNATLTMSGSVGGTITGTLTNNATGTAVATFSVNAQGNGTVTYGNGSTASIVDYMVQG